jgi:hypothetical protein
MEQDISTEKEKNVIYFDKPSGWKPDYHVSVRILRDPEYDKLKTEEEQEEYRRRFWERYYRVKNGLTQ